MKITSGLTGSKVDARGGIVGGCVEIQDLNTISKRYLNVISQLIKSDDSTGH